MGEQVLNVKLGGDTSDFQRAWGGATSQLTAFGAKAKEVGNGMADFGAKMTFFTAPLSIAMGVGVKAFSDFDDKMVQSTAIMVDASEEQIKSMETLAKEMSGRTTFASAKLAESYYFLTSAGLSVEESLAALPAVAQFAQAGMFTVETATSLLADSYKSLGTEVQRTGDLTKDMTLVSDVLTQANILSNASVQQFAEALTNEAGPAMRSYGIQLEDGVAVLAAYADQGIKGDVAGSMFGRGVRLLAQEALKNKDAFKAMGISVFDSLGAFRPFESIVSDMEKALGHLSTEERVAALNTLGFEARVQQCILPLIGTSKKIGEFKDKLEDAGGITDKVANNQLTSFASQMKLVENNMNNLGIEMGQALLPTLELMHKITNNLVTSFRDLSPETKAFIGNAVVMVTALGPGLFVFGKLISLFSPITTGIKAVASSFPAIAGAMSASTTSVTTSVTVMSGNIKKLVAEAATAAATAKTLQAEASAAALAPVASAAKYKSFKTFGEQSAALGASMVAGTGAAGLSAKAASAKASADAASASASALNRHAAATAASAANIKNLTTVTATSAASFGLMAFGITAVVVGLGFIIKAAWDWNKAANEAKQSAEDWEVQLQGVKSMYGSLEELKAGNRARSAKNAETMQKEKDILAGTLTLQEKYNAIALLQQEGKLSSGNLEQLKGDLDKLQKQIDLEKAAKDKPYKQTEDDLKAQAKYQEDLKKAVFDQMTPLQKINALKEEAQRIEAEQAKVQKGSVAEADLMTAALQNQLALREAQGDRAGELGDWVEKQQEENKNRFVGAAVEGSAAAYSASIRHNAGDPAQKAQEIANKELAEINEGIAKLPSALAEAFSNTTGAQLTEVSIP